MFKFYIFLFLLLFSSTICLGSAVASSDSQVGPSWYATLISVILCIQVILRALGEIFTKIGKHTENTWDNKIGKVLGQASFWIGTVMGKFGYGEPNEVSKKKVEKITKPKE